jgi:hypothetical protein
MFDVAQKSSKFLLDIMTLVSSANIMGSGKVFIFGGRSFMYITLWSECKDKFFVQTSVID